jgi:hypothetical protein
MLDRRLSLSPGILAPTLNKEPVSYGQSVSLHLSKFVSALRFYMDN